MKKRIVVIGGGMNVEHDVSLASAAAVAAALDRQGWLVERLTLGRDGRWLQRDDLLAADVGGSFAAAVRLIGGCDVAFPVIHGPVGEDGTLAAVCAMSGTPWVGSELLVGANCMDKWTTKQLAAAAGIRTAPGVLTNADLAEELAFSGPVVVKPVASGSSFGVTLVETATALGPAVRRAAQVDRRVLIEPFVHGREVDVAVIREANGDRWAPPPLEIHRQGIFTTESKYDGTAQFTVPAALTPWEHQCVTTGALRAFDTFGCRGVARIDFFLTDDGPVLNEINTIPGMTPTSQVPKMFMGAGISYEDLIERLACSAGSLPTGGFDA